MSSGEKIAHPRCQHEGDHEEKKKRLNYKSHALHKMNGVDSAKANPGSARRQGSYGAGRIAPPCSGLRVTRTNSVVYRKLYPTSVCLGAWL
jgi:hypothetical protein